VRWGEFDGEGANYKIAKTTAAAKAVQALERSTSKWTAMNDPSE